MNSLTSKPSIPPSSSSVSTSAPAPAPAPAPGTLRPSSTRLSLRPLPEFRSMLEKRRPPSAKFWFSVYEWIGDKVVDFSFFYLQKDVAYKARNNFHQALKTDFSNKTLSQLVSIEVDSEAFTK